MSRSSFAAVLVLAMSACKPDLPHTEPTPVAFAVFDPTTSQIPLPNDLALGVDPNSACSPAGPTGGPPACAQAELLTAFRADGLSFPNDQAVAINIDFVEYNYDASGKPIPSAPNLDLASFTATTFAIVASSGGQAGPAEIEPLVYTKAADGSKGTLTINHKGGTPWPAGSYAVFIRGGANGVQTTDMIPVGPSQTFDLIAQGLDMEDPKNIGLLKAQAGSTDAALELGAQLNQVINLYKVGLYPVVDTVFPHQELAVATTFKIGTPQTNVSIDPGRGLAPLPFDLLRDPDTGKLTKLAACALGASSLGADGKCVSAQAEALSGGFTALDGFSTTGAILGPTSDLIQANTVTASTLMLFDLSDPANPTQVPADSLIIEPCEFTSAKTATGCTAGPSLAPVIAFQPAGATAAQASPVAGQLPSIYRAKPLKDNTSYAVVMTNGILDKAGNPLASGTVAKILKFSNPVNVDGKSALSGIDDATTKGLEKMRLELAPVLAKLATDGTAKSNVAIAYTFHTQTILDTAVKLAALPYGQVADSAKPGAVTVAGSSTATGTDPVVADAYAKYGATGLPNTAIDEILETDITTFNLLDPATGAFHPNPADAAAETIHVLIATPKAAAVPACAGGLAAFGKCAPMVVFRHGLTRGRADVLALANTNAAAGMVTVAIDAAKHGDRAFCTSGTTGTTVVGGQPVGGCNPGVKCVAIAGTATQGDAAPPGKCEDNKLFKIGVAGGNRTPDQDGIAAISGNYLISANFFRTRDTMRQDLIDESQLIRALAFVPSGAPPTGNTVFDHMVGRGVIINPAAVYYTGQSLGAIQGTANVATNPRISKAVLNVGGGTVVDVFTNSPAFAAGVNQLLLSIGIDRTNPADAAKYIQFLVVAKTILDPADPINFAGHLTANPLPNLLADKTGATAQTAKKVLTQIADCDNTVPNPFNQVLASNIGTAPLPYVPTFFNGTSKGTFQLFAADNSITTLTGFLTQNCATSTAAVSHGFLLNFTNPSLTVKAQTAAASFVTTDATQNSVEQP